MLTSIGFHTFNIFLRLTYYEAISLYNHFKNNDDVRIRPLEKDEKNPKAPPKSYIVEYTNSNVGITWYVRFYEKFSAVIEKYETENKESRPFSVRAKINPKVLVGVKDYLAAANSDILDKVEAQFNLEAEKISPMLSKFEDYSMNRADFCFNADLVELDIGCTADQMMILTRLS